MDKVLTTALLTIAAVVAAVMVVNAVLPALGTGSGSVVTSSRAAADRIKTAIEIIHATYDGDKEVHFWVKNVGSTDIQNIEVSDVFVRDSSENRVEWNSNLKSCPPTTEPYEWFYTYEGTQSWTPSATIRITVCYNSKPSSEPSRVRFTTPNGKTAEKSF